MRSRWPAETCLADPVADETLGSTDVGCAAMRSGQTRGDKCERAANTACAPNLQAECRCRRHPLPWFLVWGRICPRPPDLYSARSILYWRLFSRHLPHTPRIFSSTLHSTLRRRRWVGKLDAPPVRASAALRRGRTWSRPGSAARSSRGRRSARAVPCGLRPSSQRVRPGTGVCSHASGAT
jgi:hypothetical protein